MQNLYTASEAMERLGMTQGQFQNLVRQGKLKRVIPPGRTRGMYAKKDVDEMALALQFFSAQFSTTDIRQTTPESLVEEYEIARELFGNTTTPVANRLVWLEASPDIMLDIFSDGEMMGYIKIAPLKREAIDSLMKHERVGADMTPQEFEPYAANHPIDIFIFGIGVRRGLSREESGYYASRLMSRASMMMAEKGAQGVTIQGIYTTSYTPYGISICERMGFKTLPCSTTKLRSFELEVSEVKKPPFLIRPYLKAYEEWKESNLAAKVKRSQ